MASASKAAPEFFANLGRIITIAVCATVAFAVLLSIFDQLGLPASYILFALALLAVAVYVLVGLGSRARSPTAFTVSGRNVPGLALGLAAGAGSVPVVLLFGLPGAVFLFGFDGLVFGLGLAAGFATLAIAVAPGLRRSGAETVPDFFARRFGPVARILAVLALLLCTGALLLVEVSVASHIAARLTGMGYAETVAALLLVVAATACLGGSDAVVRNQLIQYLVLLAAATALLVTLSARTQGLSFPLMSYGETIPRIGDLEMSMLEQGLVDFETFRPHAKAFLELDQLNFVALFLCLAAGTAALPHVAGRFLAAPSVREARLGGAWSTLFVVLLLIAVPACAAFAKLDFYGLIAGGTPLTALPAWIETASRADLLRVHGVSLAMLDAVAAALQNGAADAAHAFAGWSDLQQPVQAAMTEAARASLADPPTALWSGFVTTVLPAAATAAGNDTGLLTQGALTMDPLAVTLSLPGMAAASPPMLALVFAGALSAILATTGGLVVAIASALAHDVYAQLHRTAAPAHRLLVSYALVVAVAAATAVVAIGAGPIPLAEATRLILAAFSVAAAGLFPALVLGIWWKRANGWGAVAGMAGGLALCLYYFAASRYFAASFYETWSHLSNAGEYATETFLALKDAWVNAPDGEAKSAARLALETYAAGGGTGPGLANWFGVKSGAAALFAMPVGFLLVVLVSLVTPRQRRPNL